MPIRAANPDRLLKRFCRTGDPAALGALFDRTAAELLRVAVWLCGNRNDAEDLLQRTFVSVIEARASFDPRRGALPWLCGILGNHARRLQEQRARRMTEVREPASERDPAEVAADAELVAAITKLKGELGPPYREVLELHLGQGLNAKEIAERLGRPAGTVRTQLVRGLELLRRRLPSGFVAGCAPVLLSDSLQLAGLKASVMAAAKASAPAVAVALTSGGVLMGKKIVAVIPALALLLGLAVYLNWPRAAAADQPQSTPVTGRLDLQPKEEVAGTAAEVPVREPVPMPAPDAVDPGFGTVRVVVHWDNDGSPAAGVGVHVQRTGGSRLFRRDAVTDAEGVVTLRHVAPGTSYACCSHGAVARVQVAAGEQRNVELRAHRVAMARGQVLDADGRPVAGARIWVSDSSTWVSGYECGLSSAMGRFAVPLQDHHYIGARKAGHAPSLWRDLLPKQGEDCEIVLTLRGPGGSVHGSVRDERGAPIAWASVLVGYPTSFISVGSSSEKRESEPMGDQVNTDGEGCFAVDGVRLGGVDVQIWAAGHAPWRRQVAVEAASTTKVDAVLAAAGSVTGTVRDASNQPVAAAWVAFGASHDYAASSVESDAQGHFLLGDLPVGKVKVRAGKGEDRAEVTLELQAATASEWNPVLGKGQQIAGIVFGPDEQPLGGVNVGVLGRGEYEPRRWSETSAEGRFELSNVGDRPAEVLVQQHEALLRRLTGVPPGKRDLVIRLGERDLPTAKVHGRVVDEHCVPMAAGVGAHRGIERKVYTVATDAAGSFVLGPLPADTYDVAIDAAGRGTRPCGSIRLEPRTDVDLGDIVLRRPGRAELTLRDDAGRLIDGAFATLQTAGGQQAGSARFDNGKALAEPLQPGRLFLSISTGRGQVAAAEFEVRSDEVTVVALQTQPAARVDLRFRDPEASPGLTVRVRVFTSDRRLAAVLRTFAENESPLAMQASLAPGGYELECRASDGREVTSRLTVRSVAETPELTIDLPRR